MPFQSSGLNLLLYIYTTYALNSNPVQAGLYPMIREGIDLTFIVVIWLLYIEARSGRIAIMRINKEKRFVK
jgi:hypothetical protein